MKNLFKHMSQHNARSRFMESQSSPFQGRWVTSCPNGAVFFEDIKLNPGEFAFNRYLVGQSRLSIIYTKAELRQRVRQFRMQV